MRRAAALAVVLAACSSPTQLVVTADTDIAEIDGVVFEVDASAIGASDQSSNAPLSQGVPAFVSLVHEGGPLGPIVVTAVGRMGGTPIVERVARVSFVAGETRVLRLDLTRSCRSAMCADMETCVDGVCRGVDVGPGELGDWTGEPPRLGDQPDGGTMDAGPPPDDAGFDAGPRRDAAGDAGCAMGDPCNGIDDDCDGDVDEDTALETDAMNCGACGVVCMGACVARECAGVPSALAVGNTHACASRAVDVFCWGGNGDGQLGNGSAMASPTPSMVSITAPADVSLTAAATHTCLAGGEVRCWGANGSGQLGDGSTMPRNAPVGTGLLASAEACAGDEFSCARLTNGEVHCWGRGMEGQLGDESMAQRNAPGPVSLPASRTAVSVACGAAHACAALDDGSVHCWGSNDSSQLSGVISPPRSTPAPVPGVANATQVGAGRDHSCALSSTGQVFCWGRNAEGQIGNANNMNATSPQLVDGLSDAIRLGVGGRHSCAVRRRGRVACWGENGSGQLGNGSTVRSNVPVDVSGVFSASRVAAHTGWTCARTALRGVVCWGRNADGLGDGTTQSNTPVVVTLP